MNAILHIGLEKTGTTALQCYFDQNRALLLQHGIAYATSPALPDHTKLAAYALRDDVFPDIRRRHRIHSPETLESFRQLFEQDFAQEMASLKAKTVVFSNEHCSSRLISVQEIQRLYDLLKPYFEHITVVIYLRRQDKFFLSSYSTSIKSGHSQPLTIPDTETIKATPHWIQRYDYRELCQRWGTVFGENNLLVRIYQRSQLYQGDIVSDFLQGTSLPEVAKPKRLRINPSMQFPALEFLRRMNAYLPAFIDGAPNPLRADIVSLLERNPDFNRTPLRADMRRFLDFFNESNAYVAKHYCNQSDGLLFDEEGFEDLPTKESADLDVETAAAISAFLWKEKQQEIEKIKKVRMKIQRRRS
ncbi:hypothetical protein [Desulfovibrio inopinatus]|uniref:hypothetical protein n=1 Tax=Desulfovibrio inopinatus TaxID=102109 RepID=UPI0003F9E224|nr:hypothetical protein [Desulfovibrio inopinatus]